MGIAAYNRGTAAIREQISRELTSPEMQLLADLTAHSTYCHANALWPPTPFGALVIRIDDNGKAWAMNHEHKGWASFGYPCTSVWEVASRWHLVFTGIERDKHSLFFRAVPAEKHS